MSSSQIIEGLLIHLQTNKNFVQQKLYKQFAVQCYQQQQLNKIDKKKLLKNIKEIFDFGTNQQIKPFFTNLNSNIDKFIQQKNQKKVNQNQKIPIDLQNLYQILEYCVKNGFQKQKAISKSIAKQFIKQAKQVKQIKKVQTKIQPKKVQIPIKVQQQVKKQQKKKITILNPQLQAKVDKIKLVKKTIEPIIVPARISTRLDPDKIPLPKTQFKIQKFQMPNLKVGPRYLSSNNHQNNKQVLEQPIIYQQIDPQFIKNQNNKKIMRSRLQKLYQHYCGQQQNNGYSATFDKIKSQMQTMTMGKFLTFCKSTQLYKNYKTINKKQILCNSFKKIAQGKKQINFQIFQLIMKDLDNKCEQQSKKQNIKFVPYQVRLKLQSKQGYKQHKKNINMIFFTRDSQNKDNKLFSSDFGHKGVTIHSGKIQQDLKEQIQRIRYSQTINTQKLSKNKRNQNSQQRAKNSLKPKKINLQQINTKQWPRIDWLQKQVKNQKIEQNEIYMNPIRKDVVGNMKRRLNQVSRLQKTIQFQ